MVEARPEVGVDSRESLLEMLESTYEMIQAMDLTTESWETERNLLVKQATDLYNLTEKLSFSE